MIALDLNRKTKAFSIRDTKPLNTKANTTEDSRNANSQTNTSFKD